VFPDPPPRWRHIDRWPDAEARARAFAIYRQLATLDLAALGAQELTPAERPFLRFAPDAGFFFAVCIFVGRRDLFRAIVLLLVSARNTRSGSNTNREGTPSTCSRCSRRYHIRLTKVVGK